MGAAREALELFRKAGSEGRRGVADSLRAVFTAQMVLGGKKEAESLAKAELHKFKECEDTEGAAKMMLTLAELNSGQKDHESHELSILFAEDARRDFQELGMERFEGLACLVLAKAQLDGGAEGSAEEALEAGEDAEQLFRRSGDTKGEACAQHAAACAKLRLEDLPGALALAWQAASGFRALGLVKLEAIEEACIADWLLRHESQDGQAEDGPNAEKALKAACSALATFKAVGDKAGETTATEILVRAHLSTGQTQEAEDLALRFSEESRSAGDKAREAGSLHMLMAVHLAKKDPEQALIATKQAASLLKSLNNASGEAAALHVAAQMHLSRAKVDADQAFHAFQSAQAACAAQKRSGEDEGSLQATYMQTLAAAYATKGEQVKALEAANEGRDLCRESKDCAAAAAEACCLLRAASAHVELGDLESAVSTASDAQELFREAGDQRGEAGAAHIVARLQLERKEYGAARLAADTARALLRQLGEVGSEVGMLLLSSQAASLELAAGAQALGGGKAARSFYEGRGRNKVLSTAREALALSKRLGSDHLVAIARFTLSRAYISSGMLQEAASELTQALPALKEHGDHRAEASAKLLKANLSVLQGRPDPGCAKEAQEMFASIGDTFGASLAQSFVSKSQSRAQALPRAVPEAASLASGAETESPAAAAAADDAAPRSRPAAVDKMSLPLPERVKYTLTELVTDAIGAEHLEEDRALMETGMTSIASIMLRDKIQNEFPEIPEMDMTFVFDYPTIRDMTGFILQELPDDL
eukprot:TRINITY_DN50069_c0_g1_i1.p1 TRINITY_DN50069_c0_g1~~TRINITY_DN50069_c0_g1_i1.p1  ORF type:complete len:827 (-),score=240.99 TRINITY_DN50069_c0_g1_i1:60-2363(-)